MPAQAGIRALWVLGSVPNIRKRSLFGTYQTNAVWMFGTAFAGATWDR